VAITG